MMRRFLQKTLASFCVLLLVWSDDDDDGGDDADPRPDWHR